jgi:hypothetical protein
LSKTAIACDIAELFRMASLAWMVLTLPLICDCSRLAVAISSLAVVCARSAASCSRCRVLSRMPASSSSCWTVDAWLRKRFGLPLVSICSVGSIPPFM